MGKLSFVYAEIFPYLQNLPSGDVLKRNYSKSSEAATRGAL